jgi:hypothetical protein
MMLYGICLRAVRNWATALPDQCLHIVVRHPFFFPNQCKKCFELLQADVPLPFPHNLRKSLVSVCL